MFVRSPSAPVSSSSPAFGVWGVGCVSATFRLHISCYHSATDQLHFQVRLNMELGKAGKETFVVHEVEREIELPAPPDEAWESVTDAEWLGGEAEIDLVPGG